MRRLAIALAAAAVALAGCSREQQQPPPENDQAFEEPAPPPAAPAPPAEPATPPPPPPKEEPTLELNLDEPAPEPIDESEQTREDADAVGMTTPALPNAEDEEAPAAGGDSGEGGE